MKLFTSVVVLLITLCGVVQGQAPSEKGLLLEDLTWMEAEKILNSNTVVVICSETPIGSKRQSCAFADCARMKPEQPQSDRARRLAERQAAALNPTALYNTDIQVWERAAKYYRARPDGGPTFRVLEGNVWGVPKTGWVARFASSEEAERVILAAGFRFIPEEEGFRA